MKTPRRGGSTLAYVLLIASVIVPTACSNKQRLGEYDFRNRTMGAITIAPAHPEVLSGSSFDVDPDEPIGSLLRIGSEIAREVSANRVRARLDSAAAAVDVSGRMSERTHDNAARLLRARPVEDALTADYELEIRVRRYGIVASSWTARAHFLIDADMRVLDGPTGRRIWQTRVRQRDPIQPAAFDAGGRSVSNVVTAIALAEMSAEEIERALESLADYAADAMTRELADALDDVRG